MGTKLLAVADRIWRIVSALARSSRRGGRPDVGGAGKRPAAGQDLTHVVEHDHPVARQAPPLPGVKGHRVGGVAVRAVSRRA